MLKMSVINILLFFITLHESNVVSLHIYKSEPAYKWWTISSSESSKSKPVYKWWSLSVSGNSSSKTESYFDPDAVECYLKNKGTWNIHYCRPLVNDPDFMKQWYLVPKPEPQFGYKVSVDLSIIDVWMKYGYLGQGVVVVDYDDGLETNHPDLKSNYNSQYGWDFCNGQKTPDPNLHKDDYHGTAAAGIIAMEMNNYIFGVGVSPHVTLGAARINSINGTRINIIKQNQKYAEAIITKMEDIAIAVHGYVPSRDLSDLLLPYYDENYVYALEQATLKGRSGKGTINVYSAGNGKSKGFTCAFHSYANNIYAIMVAAISPWGEPTSYSARCAGIMVTAPSAPNYPQYFYTAAVNNSFTTEFGGTSASAPILAGILALVLNANVNLTWRDIQHLLVSTSSKYQIKDESSWIKNGAEFYVSHDHGFGLINAKTMVETAIHFSTVPKLRICLATVLLRKNEFTFPENFAQPLNTTGCQDTDDEVNYLEHVLLIGSVSYTEWCHLQIDLISPQGTRANLLGLESHNKYTGSASFTFKSVITWGESPRGTWTIQIYDVTSISDKKGINYGTISHLSLKFFGTKEKPLHY